MSLFKNHLNQSLFQEKPWYQSKKDAPLSKLLRITADLVSKIPTIFQHRFMKWIDDFGLFFLRVGKIIQSSQQPYFLIHGNPTGQEKISLLFQGDPASFQFFIKRLFPHKDTVTITRLDKKSIMEVKDNVDMVIFERDYFFNGYYQRKEHLVIPETISFILPLDQPIENIISSCSSRVQKDLQKAGSIGYHYKIANDLSSFSDFYHTMYLPYSTWKHQDLQKIIPFEFMRHYVLRGANLLLVHQKDDEIFGGIYEHEKNHIITQYSGVKQGKFDHIRNGIITISYYYLISLARKYQMDYIDFGASPPFLTDGLNRYKRGWNMKITPSKPVFSTIFSIKINKISDSLSLFFQENPVFFFKNNHLSLAYHSKIDKDPNRMKEEIIKQNNLNGIVPTIYYSLEEFITINCSEP